MSPRPFLVFAAHGCLVLAACGGKAGPHDGTGGTDGGSGGTGGNGGNQCQNDTDSMGNFSVKADPATNYAFSSKLTIEVSPVTPRSELFFDWSGVTTDIVGHAIDPLLDIDRVTLLLWNLSEAELAKKMNDDALAQSDMQAIVTLDTENKLSSGSLFDFTLMGTEVDEETLLNYLDYETFDPATHSYTVMTATGTIAGKGTRMLRSFRLDPTSTNTEIVIDSESTALEYSATLTDMKTTRVPADTGAISMDWTDMKVNALGNEFVPTYITEALVGKYSLSRSELEEKFLDLETIGDDLWRGEIASGTTGVLSTLENEEGEAFAGIDDSHTWVVALLCGGCSNPAPWYLAVLEPCPGLQ